jgi:hypothetical protein
MRSQMFALVLVSATVMGVIEPASAQSPYSYPWCSRHSCYFTSKEQCMTTISGIHGWCHRSPYYHAPPEPLMRR